MKEIGENLAWSIILPILAICMCFGLVKGCDIYQTRAAEMEIAKYENGYVQKRVISGYTTIWVKDATDSTVTDTLR